MISFVYISNRSGCIDLLASTLAQLQDRDFELVVVDGCPGRAERGEAEHYLKGVMGLPLRAYVKPRPRLFPWSRTGFANAMNTGVLHAGGDVVVFLHDFMTLPPDALAQWRTALAATDGRTLVHSMAHQYVAPRPDSLGDVSTWASYPLPLTAREPWIPTDFEAGYFAAPVSFFEDCNGIDERADFCSQFALQAIRAQARLNGYGLKVDPSVACHMIDHRQWDEGGWFAPQNGPWRTKGVFSDVPVEPEWTAWGANAYHFKTERQKIREVLDRPVRVHPDYHLVPTRDNP